MTQQNNGPGDQLSVRGGVNMLGLAIISHATCFTVFFRRGFGREALGLQGVCALITLMLLVTSGPVGFIYFWAWMLFLVLRRIETGLRLWRGEIIHSQYAGDSSLARMCRCSDEFGKWCIEPFVVLVIGLVLFQVSHEVGLFFIVGAGSLLGVQVIQYQVSVKRVQQMQDAQIEASYYTSQFRR